MIQSKKIIEANNCKTKKNVYIKYAAEYFKRKTFFYTNEIISVDSLSNCKNSQRKIEKKTNKNGKINKLVFAFIRFEF